MKKSAALSVVLLSIMSLNAGAQPGTTHEDRMATLRQGMPILDEKNKPAKLQNAANSDLREARAYPMQPPTIPHKIDNYQTDMNANTCMSCHARTQVEDSQAPMVSVTHYMDREGNFLAEVSPRRYFCKQCHVTQVERKDLLGNEFVDMHEMLTRKSAN